MPGTAEVHPPTETGRHPPWTASQAHPPGRHPRRAASAGLRRQCGRSGRDPPRHEAPGGPGRSHQRGPGRAGPVGRSVGKPRRQEPERADWTRMTDMREPTGAGDNAADQRREQMLRAALAVITERGYPETRIADVAERAGTSPALVIHYFKTRRQLLTESVLSGPGPPGAAEGATALLGRICGPNPCRHHRVSDAARLGRQYRVRDRRGPGLGPLPDGPAPCLHSFRISVVVNFLSGPGPTTLPKAIVNSLRTGLDPSIIAVTTLLMDPLMGLSTGAVLVALHLRQPREERSEYRRRPKRTITSVLPGQVPGGCRATRYQIYERCRTRDR